MITRRRSRGWRPRSSDGSLELAWGGLRNQIKEIRCSGGEMRKKRHRVAVAAVLAVAGAFALAAPMAQAGPGSSTTAIVSLGDSFISGEAGRWNGNSLNPYGTRFGTDRAAYNCTWYGSCSYDDHRQRPRLLRPRNRLHGRLVDQLLGQPGLLLARGAGRDAGGDARGAGRLHQGDRRDPRGDERRRLCELAV